MAKYEKLVQQLRAGVICDVCDISAECDHSSCQVIDRAADAIENLLTETAAIRRQIDNLTSAQAAMVDQFNTKLEELHETKSERDEYYTRLKGLCFCCARREDPNFDCHAKCFGHQRGSAWIYESAKSAAEAKE